MNDSRQLTTRQAAPRGPATGAAPRRVPARLDGRAKAAVIVRLLLNEGADLPLEHLPEELQAELTQQMGQMGLVDRVTLSAVVQEFAEALDGVGLSFPGGLAGALAALDGKISPQTAARLRREAGVRQAGDPWARLRGLEIEALIDILRAEAPEVAAVLLSKLEVDKSAALLARLPGAEARRIALAVARTKDISPRTVDRIGLALASQLDLRPVPAFDDAPGARLGAILNQSAAATRDDLLSGLDEADQDFAADVRRAIFTFAHIPARIAPRDIARVVRAVDPTDLVAALACAVEGADKAAAEFLMANISGRMADSLREEVAEAGAVKPADGEAAMTRIVGTIRDLVDAGEIALVQKEEEGEEAAP